jgi:hypothetical protein
MNYDRASGNHVHRKGEILPDPVHHPSGSFCSLIHTPVHTSCSSASKRISPHGLYARFHSQTTVAHALREVGG